MICPNCGNEIRENRKHEHKNDGQECLVIEIDTEKAVGFSRRRLAKNLYKKWSRSSISKKSDNPRVARPRFGLFIMMEAKN